MSEPSPWPWMKQVQVAIADAIAPVCDDDKRASVKDLIREHAEKIAKIKAGILDHPLYDERKHDDLWILRFYLSHKKSRPAIDAAKRTLDFRKEHKLDETDIRQTPPHRVATEGSKIVAFFKFCQDGTIVPTHPHPKRGVILFVRPATMDQHRAVKELTEDYWLPTFVYLSEWCHQWLDYVTRTTGRLTKSVRFLDTDGMRPSHINREYLRRNAKAVGAMEDFYPQLLEAGFICNPPHIAKLLFNTIKVILPKRLKEKIHMIHPKENEQERKRLFQHISEQDLPEQYGGQNLTPPANWDPM
mmetsp:Transcript_14810/g.22625  ORF Transcript_14810/g.22625 Transcript_14810/m.22625 type:complete len:301 (+) Transcript_14810:50-952(+)